MPIGSCTTTIATEGNQYSLGRLSVRLSLCTVPILMTPHDSRSCRPPGISSSPGGATSRTRVSWTSVFIPAWKKTLYLYISKSLITSQSYPCHHASDGGNTLTHTHTHTHHTWLFRVGCRHGCKYRWCDAITVPICSSCPRSRREKMSGRTRSSSDMPKIREVRVGGLGEYCAAQSSVDEKK